MGGAIWRVSNNFLESFKVMKLIYLCCASHILGETTADIFEVNFISDRNKTDIGFYATFTITEMGGDWNQTIETVTEVSNYLEGRIIIIMQWRI